MTDTLVDIGLSHDLAVLIAKLVGVFVVATCGLLWTLFGIWLERKVSGRLQDRLGPNRVGPFGLFQTLADTIKILLKEDLVPDGADRWLFNLAPVLSTFSVLLLWVVIPFSAGWIGTDLSIGVLYLLAAGSLGMVATLMAGWGSNNKYALLGAFRAVAQLISYEVPMVLAMLVPVLMTGSMSLQAIVEGQYIAYGLAIPLTVFIFLASSLAEIGRAPFDLLEAESELVAGFHIEYSGMKFGLFYVAEFLHAFTVGVLATVLFLGGWRIPFVSAQDTPALLGFGSLLIKSLLVYLVIMWVRTTLPRVRIDQILEFNWKFLVPLSLANLLVVALLWKIVPDTDQIASVNDALLPTLVLLTANILLIVVTSLILRERGRRERAHIAALYGPVDGAADAAPAGVGD
ncbi:MAG: NADH-quinone oxidoreductase subunit NuoH [Anaerolineae bacterium]|nr:NADH-quinone oxidoreductase subunit NuoH [Anaerolineae bacterium]